MMPARQSLLTRIERLEIRAPEPEPEPLDLTDEEIAERLDAFVRLYVYDAAGLPTAEYRKKLDALGPLGEGIGKGLPLPTDEELRRMALNHLDAGARSGNAEHARLLALLQEDGTP